MFIGKIVDSQKKKMKAKYGDVTKTKYMAV